MTYRGTTYGLPLNFKVITMIYNRKLVPTPPKTHGRIMPAAMVGMKPAMKMA